MPLEIHRPLSLLTDKDNFHGNFTKNRQKHDELTFFQYNTLQFTSPTWYLSGIIEDWNEQCCDIKAN